MARKFKKYAWDSICMVVSSKGNYVLWNDVAPYIKEARPTVRAKRPVQQRKAKMPLKCGTCFYNICNSSSSVVCVRPDGAVCSRASYYKRGTSAVA